MFEEDPVRRLAALVLRRLNVQYALMGRVRLDDNSQHDTGFFPSGKPRDAFPSKAGRVPRVLQRGVFR